MVPPGLVGAGRVKVHAALPCAPNAAKAEATTKGSLMSVMEILLPLFVQIVLTFVLGFWMGATRFTTLRSGQVHPRDIALRQPNWPARATQISNAFHNQLEIPILFYVLTILLLVTRTADFMFTLLAWIFVATRLAHAYVHVTSNRVRLRGGLFMLGVIVLAVMWGLFMIRIVAVV